jgi:hypothetical protein
MEQNICILLVCNWLYSVGQNHFYVMMHLNKDSAIQNSSRRFCTVYKSKSDPLQPFERHDIPSRRLTVQSIIHPDLPLCREVSNCSILHPSGHFSSTSGRHSVFDQLWDLFPKHRYGKIPATVRTMCIPVWTCSSIRQVAYSKFRRPDDSLHGPDAQTTYMEIACIRSTVWTRKALLWKLRAAKVRPSRRQGNTVRTWLKSGQNLNKIFESRSHSCTSRCLMSTVRTAPKFFKLDAHLNLQPINKGP